MLLNKASGGCASGQGNKGAASCMPESLIFCPNEILFSPFMQELFLEKILKYYLF